MVTLIYYLFCGYIVFLLIWNFVETDNMYEEILHVIVFIPFVLRILRIN